MQINNKLANFSPLVFLASLGAGGIAVMPFVLLQYTVEHGKGLITRAELWSAQLSGLTSFYYYFLEAVMIAFAIIHFILTIYFLTKLFGWLKTDKFKTLLNDPLKNTALLAPLISILMTMNVLIGPLRYFLPVFSQNF